MRRTGWFAVAALACAVAAGCTRSSSRAPGAAAPPPPPPAPLTLTGIDPTHGPVGGGNQVLISGTGFLSGANVRFEGTLGTNAQILSPTTIIVTVPAGVVGPADVEVTLADGRQATLTNGYQYGTPAPIASAITPTSGAVVGGTLVTITGTGFVRNGTSQATVTIGGNPATNVTVVSAGMITAITPSSSVTGAVNVVVTNPDLLSSTLSGAFTYQTDTTPPTFGGVQGVKRVSPYALELWWNAATDDSTAPSLITYAVYPAATSGGQTFGQPLAITAPGALRFVAGGLSPASTTFFVVRALDLSGNEDSNAVELAGTTAAAVSPAWAATAAMSASRADPAVVRLTDGRVLAAGGRDGTGPLASAELYDPAAGTWTATGTLSAARDQAAASLLPDGRVLVTGGVNGGGRLATCEIWDPATGTWTATGSLGAARQRPAAWTAPARSVRRSCTTPRPRPGPARDPSALRATGTTRCCCPTAACWRPAAAPPAGSWRPARSSTRPPAPGPPPAPWGPRGWAGWPRRCATAACSSPAAS
ncbi:MAG: IPT/TIG domain-containing protein, partial [Planctomycetota bacterium]